METGGERDYSELKTDITEGSKGWWGLIGLINLLVLIHSCKELILILRMWEALKGKVT